jgi:hypothetical protein
MSDNFNKVIIYAAAHLFVAAVALIAPGMPQTATAETVVINPSFVFACEYSDSTAPTGNFGRVGGQAKKFARINKVRLQQIISVLNFDILNLSRRVKALRSSAAKSKLSRKLSLFKTKKRIVRRGAANCKRSFTPTPTPRESAQPTSEITPAPTLRPNCPDLPVTITKPYSGRPAVGSTVNSAEAQAYQWYLNGTPAASGTTATTFLAHFDGSPNGANGETPLTQVGVSFENSAFGQGMVGSATYPMSENFDLEEGTIEFWMKLKRPLSDPVFADDTGEPHIFRYTGTGGERVMVNIKSDLGILLFTIYDGSGDWANGSVQLGSTYNEILSDQPVFLSMTFSKSQNRSALFLNGFKIAQNDYHFPIVPSGNFTIGNSNIVIDEFRIFAEVLPPSVIMSNYTSGRPFASNEAYYAQEPVAGDNLELNFGECWDTKIVTAPKMEIANDPGYVLSNRSSIALDFETTEAAVCAYGQAPGLFSELGSPDTSATTLHHFEQPVTSTIPTYPIYIKCRAEGETGDESAFYRRFRVQPNLNGGFPRTTAIFWGNTAAPSEVADIARYDFITLAKSNLSHPTILKSLRDANPEALLTFYIEPNANPVQYGVTSFEHEDLKDRLLDSWRLRNAEDGSYAYNLYFPGVWMYNTNPAIPFTEKLVEHIEEDIVARGDWNGIFFDNTDSTFWQFFNYSGNPGSFVQYLDFDLDGINEDLNVPADLAKAKTLVISGLTNLFTRTRATLGESVIINGNNGDAISSQYNGKCWERFFKPNVSSRPPQTFFDMSNTNSFVSWAATTQAPQVNTNIFENSYTDGTVAHYRFNRWGLAGSLIGGVHHVTVRESDYRTMRWYDEYWVNLLTAQPTTDRAIGHGYLGQPLSAPYESQSGVWRRDFENGIALINLNSGTVSAPLVGTFRYILGVQDPAANPGGLTSAITLNGYDGRVLLRALCSNNPDHDPRCISN